MRLHSLFIQFTQRPIFLVGAMTLVVSFGLMSPVLAKERELKTSPYSPTAYPTTQDFIQKVAFKHNHLHAGPYQKSQSLYQPILVHSEKEWGKKDDDDQREGDRDKNKKPEIVEVFTDFGSKEITIIGKHFGTGNKLKVTLGSFSPLSPLTVIDTMIVVPFPAEGLLPGDYLLTVSRHKKEVSYNLTVGAVGPQGAKGEKGDTGDTGPAGTGGQEGGPFTPAFAGKFCPSGLSVVGFNEAGNCVCSDVAGLEISECQDSLPSENLPSNDCPCTGKSTTGGGVTVVWESDSFQTNSCLILDDRVQLSAASTGSGGTPILVAQMDTMNLDAPFSCSITIPLVGSNFSRSGLTPQQFEACQQELLNIASADNITCQ